LNAQEKQEILDYYADLLGEEVFSASWKLLQREGYSESSLAYLSPEIVHEVCGSELMKTWKEKIFKKYPYV
jgi:hypothetical protein